MIALDDSKQEIIVMAKGIGFKNKVNAVVDEDNYPNMQKYVLDNIGYDEIRQAYQRLQKGMYLRNALTNEIKTFYHDEFVISTGTVSMDLKALKEASEMLIKPLKLGCKFLPRKYIQYLVYLSLTYNKIYDTLKK